MALADFVNGDDEFKKFVASLDSKEQKIEKKPKPTPHFDNGEYKVYNFGERMMFVNCNGDITYQDYKGSYVTERGKSYTTIEDIKKKICL